MKERMAMCRYKTRRLVGLCAASFGLGILLSYFIPGFFLSFLEAIALVVAGILLLGSSK